MIEINNINKTYQTGKSQVLALQDLSLKVGLPEIAAKKANQLSGGQRQRVAIARAIVNQPDIILADEPTGALDSQTSLEIMELFRSLNELGNTVLVITHDDKVAAHCRRRILIEDGRLVSDSAGGNHSE